MGRDSQTKMSKKESTISKRKPELTKGKKLHQESSDDDDASFYTDDDSENELDILEYRKFLKNMFPSKYLDKKIRSGERLKQSIDDDNEEEEEDEQEEEEEIKSKKSKKNIKKHSKKIKQKKSKAESSEEEE